MVPLDNTNYYYTLSYYGGSWWAVYNSQVDFPTLVLWNMMVQDGMWKMVV